jgi:tetratricopeptide (TPR) repeat protein
LKTGLANHPDSYEIFRDLILYLSDIGKYHDIITLCQNANFVQMDFETDMWNILGLAYWKTGDLEKAQETYKKAISIDDENPFLFNNIGNVYFSLFHKTKKSNFLEIAIQSFEKALELDPNNSQAYFGLGTACLAAHDLDKAIDYWEQAYKISPSHASTAYNLSRAYYTRGDKQKTLALLQKYLKNYFHLLSPENKKKFNELIQKSKN